MVRICLAVILTALISSAASAADVVVKLGDTVFRGPQEFVEKQITAYRADRDKLSLDRYNREEAARQRGENLAYLNQISTAPATVCCEPMPSCCSRYCKRNRCACCDGGPCRCGSMARCGRSCSPSHCSCGTSCTTTAPAFPNVVEPKWLTPRKFRYATREWILESGDAPSTLPTALQGSFYIGSDDRARFLDASRRVWVDQPSE